MGDKGACQGGIGVNSDGFLRHWTRGVSTPDLIVTEFRMGCRQMDLASACVLRPLESSGPVFQDGRVDRMNERRGLQRGEELKRIVSMVGGN